MKLFFEALALTFLLAYMADMHITFRPFSISFGRGWMVLGMILIALGAGIIYYQGRWDGLRRGAEISKEAFMDAIKVNTKEKK